MVKIYFIRRKFFKHPKWFIQAKRSSKLMAVKNHRNSLLLFWFIRWVNQPDCLKVVFQEVFQLDEKHEVMVWQLLLHKLIWFWPGIWDILSRAFLFIGHGQYHNKVLFHHRKKWWIASNINIVLYICARWCQILSYECWLFLFIVTTTLAFILNIYSSLMIHISRNHIGNSG